MNKMQDSVNGYSVLDEGGLSSLSYGASECFFKSFNQALDYALKIIKDAAKTKTIGRRITIYECKKSDLNKSHSIPGDKVVFVWSDVRAYE